MGDDELALLAREVDGEERLTCARCGRWLPLTAAAWEPAGLPDDAADDLLLCAACRAGVEHGDVDLALELDDDE